MFGRNYFGGRYFGGRYFGDGGAGAPPAVLAEVVRLESAIATACGFESPLATQRSFASEIDLEQT